MILLTDSKFQKLINIFNHQEFSILEIANIIKDLINPKLKFYFKDLPQDDPKQRKTPIQLAKEFLNWEPKVELREGLIKSIKWFKSNL